MLTAVKENHTTTTIKQQTPANWLYKLCIMKCVNMYMVYTVPLGRWRPQINKAYLQWDAES